MTKGQLLEILKVYDDDVKVMVKTGGMFSEVLDVHSDHDEYIKIVGEV
jgi:hypothetical protein